MITQKSERTLFGGPAEVFSSDFPENFSRYVSTKEYRPILFCGDCKSVLESLPPETIDCCITSPPYWGKRQYSNGGFGLEANYEDFISHILGVTAVLKRVLKRSGSFWLNIGDTYRKKCLLGIPWRIAIRMIDDQGWILRNAVVWNKVKGGLDNTKDKLRNVYEQVFHFVRSPKYYYDVDSIRTAPKQARVVKGAVVSATGVSGVRYKRQIELSSQLTKTQKASAFAELQKILGQVANGEIADFRMIIQGQQRTTHSDSEKVSGRARELREKGFYFLRYHPNGSKPSDVWDILPEDTQKRGSHFAPYPEDLCKIPIIATCPPDGIVLDPFCGTGTSMLVSMNLRRKSVGIDISSEYLAEAKERCHSIQ